MGAGGGGYISGLKGHQLDDGSPSDRINFNFDGEDNKGDLNVSNAISDTGVYPAWKAFNQKINGNFDDYMMMDEGGFPYYLIYDFGPGETRMARSYTISSAGASAEYYSEEKLKKIFGEVFAPVEWKLFGSNVDSDELQGDENMKLLHHVRDVSRMPYAEISKPNSKVHNSDYTDSPEEQKALVTVEGSKHNSYVSVPGAVRNFNIPVAQQDYYRYYILKILAADGNQGIVKIADFGLRGLNDSYAGFIRLSEG